MTLLISFVILSVICSGVANGFGRVGLAVVVVEALPVVVVVVVILAILTYPIVGDFLKSSTTVDTIRFSAVLMAVLSPAIL